MVSIPRYLNDDEATVVLAALEPFHHKTFGFLGRRGSFFDFARLPDDVRNTINRALTEHRGGINAYEVYSEPVDDTGALHYVLGTAGVEPETRYVVLSNNLDPLSPHIVELARQSVSSFTEFFRARWLIALIILVMCTVGVIESFHDGKYYWMFAFAALTGVIGFVLLLLKMLFYRRSSDVHRALFVLEEHKTAPPVPSVEEIIRAKGGSFGPNPKPA